VVRWYGGYGTPLVTDALISSRDGIVDAWEPKAVLRLEARALDDAGSMERWEPWVRAAVLDFELLSNLHFVQRGECAILGHWAMQADADHGRGGSAADTARLQGLAGFIRPPPDTFIEQLRFLASYADLRADRETEILAQLAPPLAFWSSILNLHPDHKRWTLELVEAALRLANFAEMRIKQALACRRAVEYSPQVQPMILTPGHGSLPSGHSTEGHFVAALLIALRQEAAGNSAPVLREELMRLASRVAVNRTVAGVHFPVDSVAGAILGLKLAEYFVARCRERSASTTLVPWIFLGGKYPGCEDFDSRKLYDTDEGKLRAPPPYVEPLSEVAVAGSALLNWLWKKAEAEWS
jgi:hypothetical protein